MNVVDGYELRALDSVRAIRTSATVALHEARLLLEFVPDEQAEEQNNAAEIYKRLTMVLVAVESFDRFMRTRHKPSLKAEP